MAIAVDEGEFLGMVFVLLEIGSSFKNGFATCKSGFVRSLQIFARAQEVSC